MTNKLTEEELIERGFTSFKPTMFDSESVDKCYQKCYRNEKGDKKYFLDAKHFNLTHPTTGEDLGGWELSTQLYVKGNHHAINLTFLEDDIDEAVSLIEFLYEGGQIENYENAD